MMRKETLQKYKNIPKGKYHNHVGFAAMTEDLDSGLGLLLNHIEKLGINENTYIIYTLIMGRCQRCLLNQYIVLVRTIL